jgi:hypothetical protein
MSWSHYDENRVMIWAQGRFDETGIPGNTDSAVGSFGAIIARCKREDSTFYEYWPMSSNDDQVPFFNMKFYWQDYNTPLEEPEVNILKTYTAITALPNLDSHGYLDSNSYFRISWLRNLLSQPDPDADELVLNLTVADRWAKTVFEPGGSWESFVDFWTTTYPNVWFTGYRAFGETRASVTSRRYENPYDDDEDPEEIVEILYSRFVSEIKLTWEAENVLPRERTASATSYDSYHTSITTHQEYKHCYPWVTPTPGTADRDYRVSHFKINPGTSYTALHDDIRSRFKKIGAVETACEGYIASKVDYFNSLLEMTISTPKEFRVRTQASPVFDLNKLTTMPMSDNTSATSTTSPTTTSAGGSSY